MKKKTEGKVKKENKSDGTHWSAFDEGVWGPTSLRKMLDRMRAAVEDGTVLTLSQFTARESLSLRKIERLAQKHPFFHYGLEVIKELIYAKRFEIALDNPDQEGLMNEFGLKHYDTLRELKKEYDDTSDMAREKEMASFKNDLAKDLSTHQSGLRTQEIQQLSPLARTPHFIQASNGLFYSNIDEPGKTKEEVECFLKNYLESTTSKPDGISSQ